ncbi:MAG: hypothetical protein RIC87_12285 [Kiloniellales bacterium]
MPLFRQTPAFPRDPLFRAVLGVLLFSAVASIIISLLAENRWNQPLLSEVAGYASLVSLLGYVGVRWLGIRAVQREEEERQRHLGRDEE